jgi:hypothetical protein
MLLLKWWRSAGAFSSNHIDIGAQPNVMGNSDTSLTGHATSSAAVGTTMIHLVITVPRRSIVILFSELVFVGASLCTAPSVV